MLRQEHHVRASSIKAERVARVASGKGCSTAVYDPHRHIEGYPFYSKSHAREHASTMPAFIREEDAHVTLRGNVEIMTFCRRGRLNTVVHGG